MSTGSSLDGSWQVQRAEGALWRRCPRVALVLVGDRVHSLAAAGTDIWDMTREPSTVEGLAARLADRYEGDPTGISEDVSRSVEELLALGVLEAVVPPDQ